RRRCPGGGRRHRRPGPDVAGRRGDEDAESDPSRRRGHGRPSRRRRRSGRGGGAGARRARRERRERRGERMIRRAGWLGCAVLGACAGGPDPVPLRGEAPARILVAPVEAPELFAPLARALDATVFEALRPRGYEIVPPAVARNMIGVVSDDGVVEHPEVLAALAREFDVDAVLVARAAPLGALDRKDPLQTRFRVEWALLDTDTAAVLWVHSEVGGGARRTRRLLTGPVNAYEDDPFLSDTPLLGRGHE